MNAKLFAIYHPKPHQMAKMLEQGILGEDFSGWPFSPDGSDESWGLVDARDVAVEVCEMPLRIILTWEGSGFEVTKKAWQCPPILLDGDKDTALEPEKFGIKLSHTKGGK